MMIGSAIRSFLADEDEVLPAGDVLVQRRVLAGKRDHAPDLVGMPETRVCPRTGLMSGKTHGQGEPRHEYLAKA